MALATEVVARRYIDVTADTPISVDVPAFVADEVFVYYGAASLVAVQGSDYTLTLAGDFNTVSVTPLQALIDKINALIAADATEINYITVRRTLDGLTEATPDGVRYTPFTSREFERVAMRHQQLNDKLARSLSTGEGSVDPLPPIQGNFTANTVLKVAEDGLTIKPGPTIAEIENAEAHAVTASTQAGIATDKATEAQGFRDEAAAYSYVNFFNKTDMLATTKVYGDLNAPSVGGTYWRVGLMIYKVAASGATDHHETTTSGIKLYEAGSVYSSIARAVQGATDTLGFIQIAGIVYARDVTYDGDAVVQTDGGTVSWSAVVQEAVVVDEKYAGVLVFCGQSGHTSQAGNITTDFPTNLLSFSDGHETGDQASPSNVDTARNHTSFDPATVGPYGSFDIANNKESHAPSFFNADECVEAVAYTAANGSEDTRNLLFGSAHFATTLMAVKGAWEYLIQFHAKQNIKVIILWNHGESATDLLMPGGGGGETPATQEEYLDVLTDLYSSLVEAVPRVTEAGVTPLLLLSSPNLVGAVGTAQTASMAVLDAYLAFAKANSGVTYMRPRYMYSFKTDGTHLTPQGIIDYETDAKADFSTFLKGGARIGTHFTGVNVAGANVVLTAKTPDNSDLVIDTTTVPETTTSFSNTLYGIAVYDLTAAAYIDITSGSVSGKELTLVLDSTPTGLVRVECGILPWPGATQAVTGVGSKLARTNITTTSEKWLLQHSITET